MLEDEIDEDEDFIYARTDDGTLCRFLTDGLTDKERVTFGFQETEAENFEDMRRRIGDPEVCSWIISYEEYLLKKQTRKSADAKVSSDSSTSTRKRQSTRS